MTLDRWQSGTDQGDGGGAGSRRTGWPFRTSGAERPAGATDFNDMAAHCSAEAVTRAIASAERIGEQRRTNGFNLVSASELLAVSEPETRWIWDGVLPEGGMSLMVGKPKAGKSTFAFALSWRLPTGRIS